MRPNPEGRARTARIVHAKASEISMDRLSGRVLFPTTSQGPWLPLLTFRETTAEAPWVPDLHGHTGEEVVNYVLEGELVRATPEGQRSVIASGGVSVEASREEQRHDIFPASERSTRWLSVVVHLPARFPVPSSSFRSAGPVTPIAGDGGARLRRLVGSGASTPSVAGLDLLDLGFEGPAVSTIPVPTGRRAVAYVAEGAGRLFGRAVQLGDGAMTDDVDEIPVEGDRGFRVLLASVPSVME